MSVVSLHSKSTAGYNSQPSTNNTFHTLLTALHYILLFNFTYDSTEEPELPVHQVPDPLECSLLAVEHQDPGGVLGGAGDHQHVAVNVEVGLTLNIDMEHQTLYFSHRLISTHTVEMIPP